MPSTWLITGASSGFGRELTELLLERGDRVAATLRDPSRLDGLAAVHGSRLWRAALDVTDTERVRGVVDSAWADLGRIDVVVSNAGYGLFGAAEELTDAQIDRQIATNVVGAVQLVRAALPHLRAQGGGRILQTSSMGGQIAFPGLSLYHLSKWAIEGFFEALAPEVEPFGIATTLVEPGMARTGFGSASADVAPPLDAYAGTPAAAMVRGEPIPSEAMPGDPRRIAQAMATLGDMDAPPRRQALGSDAYALIRSALTDRLQALEDQRDLTMGTDADDVVR
jgi:NAD(P)-dependent dehydrogenase (short-subunit alcohol dehydrogenase family)